MHACLCFTFFFEIDNYYNNKIYISPLTCKIKKL